MNVETVATENQNYYLSEQKADDSGSPWFRYAKTMDSYAEAVMLSPQMARDLLEAGNDSAMRKPISLNIVNDLVRDLKAGKSLVEHPISISFSGKLLDGRLPLQAVIAYKKPVVAYISFNISDKLRLFFE